ncbi:MAG TPA: LysM peptidoglycan-binding domain-containing protein [Phycisphaerales bacterium]|nr:LysM peptidoglycan-binding domain-containing protein [Phycisphaerales bacterium]
MNRETKLALLIGFVAIVVVTVLLGEHFGKARNAAPASTELGTSTAAAPSGSGLTVDPITSIPVATPSAPLVLPSAGGIDGQVQPVALTGGPTPTTPNTMAPTAVMAPAGGQPVLNADPNRFIPAAGIDQTGLPAPSAPQVTPGNGAGPELEVPGTLPVNTLGESPVARGRPVSTGVEKMHPVARGETIAALAQRYYGDKGLTKQLAAYNAKRLSANGVLREGVTLRIPPRDVLMGTAVLSPAAVTQAEPTGPARSSKPQARTENRPTEKPAAQKAKTGPRTYVIKKGDTLMSIASKELGSAKRWESLLVANPSLDENSLRAGMTIKIPAK